MKIPSQPRRTGERKSHVHFQYVPIERGQPFEAYTAGPAWWGYLHMLKPSKPCVYELTGREVECRYCGKARMPVMKGWVPLYRKWDGFPVMVCVDESLRDSIDPLKLHTKVNVGRGKGSSVSAWVQMSLDQEPRYVTTLPERQVEADVTVTLITVWDLPEVTQFFCSKSSDNALSLNTKGSTDGVPAPAPAATDSSDPAGAYLLDADSFGGLLPLRARDKIRERRNEAFVREAQAKPKPNGKH